MENTQAPPAPTAESIRPVAVLSQEMSAMEDQPWSRRDGESLRHHGLLLRYCSQGYKRSLLKVAKETHVSMIWLEKLSAQWEWVNRAMAWDAALERQRADEIQKSMIRMAESEAKATETMLRIINLGAMRRLKSLIADENEKLSAKDLGLLYEIVAKSSRAMRGEPGEITKTLVTDGESVADAISNQLDQINKHKSQHEQVAHE